MLSINTNTASMAAVNAINKSSASLSTSMERLATGNRINSSADDAAGKQIASRLSAQSDGMGVALSNIQDATAMLQTADSMFDEMTDVLGRMKDLSTQAANGTYNSDDLQAMQDAIDPSMRDTIVFESFYHLAVMEDGSLALPDGRTVSFLYRMHPMEILIEETADQDASSLGELLMDGYKAGKFHMMNPPESLIIMRALDIIGYTVSLISERSSRCFASVAVSPTLAASGFENTICGMVSSSSGFGSSPAMDSAAMMPCSNAR